MAVSLTTLVPRVRDLLSELGDQTWATQGSAASAVSVIAVTNGAQWEEGAIGERIPIGAPKQRISDRDEDGPDPEPFLGDGGIIEERRELFLGGRRGREG